MQLKPVFASVLLLGLSGTAFGMTSNTAVQTRLNAMQAELNQMQQVINQNGGGAQGGGGTSLQSTLGTSSDWFNMISVSGLLNADAIASSRTPVANSAFVLPGQADTGIPMPPVSAFGHNSSTDFMLSNADLFVDAQVNDWTKAHVGLNYQSNNTQRLGDFNSDDAPIVIQNISGPLVDEAYITLGNFTETPFYFRAGKQYVNFGNYDRYATVPTFTQLLTETNQTAATLGFVANGFFGSVYGFRGTPKNVDLGNTINVNNFGADLGFMQHACNYGFNVQASYLNNIADVLYVNSSNEIQSVTNNTTTTTFGNSVVNQTGVATSGNVNGIGFFDRVGGLSLDASGNINMFDGYAHYMTALSDFNQGYERVNNTNIVQGIAVFVTHNASQQNFNSRLRALDVGAGVTFDVIGHTSRFGLDYQRSWDAQYVGLYGLPKHRYEGTYNMEVSKNVNVGLDVYHDKDYSNGDNGTGRNSTTGVLRLGVMFA